MIDTECESHGIYQLQIFANVGMIIDSPFLIHAPLGHPSLAKMQQIIPCLSIVSHVS